MDKKEIVKTVQKLKLEKNEIIWVTLSDGVFDIDQLVSDFSEVLKEHGLDNIAVFVPANLPLKTMLTADAIKELDRMIEGMEELRKELIKESECK